VQQAGTMFVNLMVYGSDGKPTWLVAASSLQANSPTGHTVFLGDLYATTGPYYGGTFDPALVGERKVGTLTFDANAPNSATMSYTVDGTPVVKNVTRQTWSHEDLTGLYYVGWNADCGGVWRTLFDGPIAMTISHNEGSVWINLRNLDTPAPGIVRAGPVKSDRQISVSSALIGGLPPRSRHRETTPSYPFSNIQGEGGAGRAQG
jgi:hypothetical protein